MDEQKSQIHNFSSTRGFNKIHKAILFVLCLAGTLFLLDTYVNQRAVSMSDSIAPSGFLNWFDESQLSPLAKSLDFNFLDAYTPPVEDADFWRRTFRARIEHYKANENKVEGWMIPADGYLAFFLSHAQHKAGVFGTVGEIGIHYGKYFVPLALSATSDEKLWGCEVFENQDEIVDNVYLADTNLFVSNLKFFNIQVDQVTLALKSSTTLVKRDFGQVPQFRFLSVDGGHTTEVALNDLLVAEKILKDGGIVSLDDFINLQWGGVNTALGLYFAAPRETAPRLVPFLITSNKVYLTTESHYQIYFDAIEAVSTVTSWTDFYGKKINLASAIEINWDLF